MEWNVKNALSRDVERQQLNKILKEIRNSIGSVTASSAITERIVTETRRQGSSTPSTPAPVNITVTLTGDVSGEGNGTSTIEIPVVVDRTIFVTQAPQDNTPYWRINSVWEAINPILRELNYLDGKGIPVYNNESSEANSPWSIVQFEVESGELTLGNADGTAGNPLFGLADVANSGLGEILGITRDGKGRVSGTRAVTTDDLDEGTTNLYFTEAPIDGSIYGRKDGSWQVAVGGGGGGGTVTSVGTGTGLTGGPITGSGTISLSSGSIASLAKADLAVVPVGVPADGDILEYDGTTSDWKVTKDPRELYLDGGNF